MPATRDWLDVLSRVARSISSGPISGPTGIIRTVFTVLEINEPPERWIVCYGGHSLCDLSPLTLTASRANQALGKE
jgi:hypothetical protein